MCSSRNAETMQDMLNHILHHSLKLLGMDFRVTVSRQALPEPIAMVYSHSITGEGATFNVVSTLTYPMQL